MRFVYEQEELRREDREHQRGYLRVKWTNPGPLSLKQAPYTEAVAKAQQGGARTRVNTTPISDITIINNNNDVDKESDNVNDNNYNNKLTISNMDIRYLDSGDKDEGLTLDRVIQSLMG